MKKLSFALVGVRGVEEKEEEEDERKNLFVLETKQGLYRPSFIRYRMEDVVDGHLPFATIYILPVRVRAML